MLKLNVRTSHKHNKRNDTALQIVGIVQVCGEKDWGFPPHIHEDLMDMVLLTSGQGKLFYSNREFETGKGDLLIFNQGLLHGEQSDPQDPLETIGISLTGVRIDGYALNCVLPEDTVPIIKTGAAYEVLRQMFDYCKLQCVEKKEGYEIVLQDMAKAILSVVMQILPVGSRPFESEEMNFPAIQQVVEYLDAYYNQPITLEQIAKKFHFSSFYIARKFKDETGYTINQYITNRRMGEAEKMLIFTDRTINEIAQKIGYENVHHFYATFKKHTGCAPGKFKELYNMK